MPNPNRPENANSIAPGATVAMLTTARIQHEGVTNRYIDTNTGRRAACDQWLILRCLDDTQCGHRGECHTHGCPEQNHEQDHHVSVERKDREQRSGSHRTEATHTKRI